MREGAELCDGADVDGKTCADFGHNQGALACADDCTFDVTDCHSVEICGNGQDDDGDDLVDCDDDECAVLVDECPRCGDGVVNGTDACDGTDIPQSCTDLGFDSGTIACAEDCTLDTSACVNVEDCGTPGDEDGDQLADCDDPDCDAAFECPRCGNGVVQQGETCDGSVPAGVSCGTFGHNSGTVRCDAASCTIDSSACRTVELCGNGLDDDGDGATDCSDSDCAGLPPCPFCGNGLIEAGETCDDGNTISNDGCSAACAIEGDTCASPIVLGMQHYDATLGAWIFNGDTTPYTSGFSAGCTFSYTERDGVLAFTAPEAAEYQIDYITNYDGVLFVLDENCTETNPVELGCSDPGTVNVHLAAGQTIHIVVDGWGSASDDDYGPYTLIIQEYPCGDGVLQGSEVCDFGDAADGDGCSSTCQVEPGWVCNATGCRRTVCGDGIIEGVEECDDQNNVPDDGCNACVLNTCGNGAVDRSAVMVTLQSPVVTNPYGETGHVCDDFSGCSLMTCDLRDVGDAPEHGICQSLGYQRTASVTWGGGAGATDPVMPHAYNWSCSNFQCGPGSTGAFSNCSSFEMLNSITCVGAPALEQCDDGNTNPNDACTNTCRFNVCGDGILYAGVEACDDGNTVGGDGCGPTCQLEAILVPQPGRQVTLRGSLASSDPTWTRPSASCSAGTTSGQYFKTFTLDNPHTTPQRIRIVANWGSVDGYVHVFSAPFDPANPTVNCIAGDDDYVLDDSYLTATIQPGGSIVVVASTFSAGGTTPNFSILVYTDAEVSEPDNDAATAHPITPGTMLMGSISPGDRDYFSFAATAGTTYTIEDYVDAPGYCEENFSPTTDADSRLRLYDVDGVTELTSDDDAGVGLCSRITWTAPSSGTYYFRVQYYSDTNTSNWLDPYFVELRSP